ncbi:MAG: phosphoglycerate kinase, partial [Proteobacteria bacterium]|nr:phosphoglycerate kinase [Pseudomonadota bacterium]
IGPRAADDYIRVLKRCKTVIWNGPLGAFEIRPFDRGTTQVARAIGNFTKKRKMISIAGGGDTVAALYNAGAKWKFSHVSTAGGAFLEWLEGKTLPGIKALMSKG